MGSSEHGFRLEIVTTGFPPNEDDVTPSNDAANNFAPSMVQALADGDIAYQPAGGGSSLIRTCYAGDWIPVTCTQVLSTETTCASIRRVF